MTISWLYKIKKYINKILKIILRKNYQKTTKVIKIVYFIII